jgi:acyl-CoA thioester hydrolase
VIDEFRHLTHVPVRFRDIDAFGHVNNAVFSTYTEHARVRYLLDVLEVDPVGRMPLILGMIRVDFRSPIMLRDTVEIGSRVDWIGRSSIAMSHLLRATDGGRELAKVSSILVAYDYAVGQPIPVPEEWRTKMASYEGRSLERPPQGGA